MPCRRGDRMSAAGTRSQAGMRARVYCLQAALQMACLSQNNLSMCLPTWTCWDVFLCYLWVRRVHCSCFDGSSSWYLPKILEGWKINLGAYTLALCIGCLSTINILALEMIQVDEIGEGLVAYHTHHWCLRPWIPADPHGEFVMSLLEFQSPYWEHLDLSNKQMKLVCLWVPGNHDLATLSLRLDIGHQARSDSLGKEISWVYRWSVGSLQRWAARGWSPCCFVMLWCYTSCNNKIIPKELFLAYLGSLRAIQLPSTAVSKLIAAVLKCCLLAAFS